MFITKYERYAQYDPAEGGIYIHGLSREETEEVRGEQEAKDMLKELFYKELEHYGIDANEVDVTEMDWGTRYTAGDEEVSIRFYLDNGDLVSDRCTDESDGTEYEDYHSWVEVEENSPYVDCFCYKYIPESEEGIHERPAIYC